MASNTEKRITAKMILDSTGYNASIKGINSEMKKYQSQMKVASEGIKAFGKDSEKLKSVQESLSKQVELHTKKVNMYKEAMEKSSSKMKDNIKKRNELKESLCKEENELKKIIDTHGKELKGYIKNREELNKLNKEYKEASKKYGENSIQAKKLKEEIDKLENEQKKLTLGKEKEVKAYEKSKEKVEKLTKEYEKNEKSIETNAKQVQNYETNMNKAEEQMVKTQGELKKINKELDDSKDKWIKSSENLKKSSEKLKDIGGKINSAGDSILKITAPLAAGGIASIKFADDFETGVAKVSTIADTSQVPVEGLRKSILKLSDDTGVASTEIAESSYQAISASVETGHAVEFVGTATKASVAGFTDASTAVNGLSTVLNSYGMEATKADKIANQMLITQNEGKTSFGELASAVGKVTPIAANLGVTTEELFSSLASTTAQGLATSESVTALKAAMSNIIKPSEDAAKAAESLGIEFQASQVKAKGWMPFLQDMTEKLKQASPQLKEVFDEYVKNIHKVSALEKSKSKESKEELAATKRRLSNLKKEVELLAKASDSPVAAMATMFGSIEGLNSMLMLTSQQGAAKYNKAMNQMKTNTTALDDAYQKMTNTRQHRMKKSLNQLKNQSIRLGEVLAPVVNNISSLIGKVADKLGKLDEKQLKHIATIGMVTVSAGGLLKVAGNTISAIGTVKGGVGSLIGFLGGLNKSSKGAGLAAKILNKGLGFLGKTSKGLGVGTKAASLGIKGVGTASKGVEAGISLATGGIGKFGLATKALGLICNPVGFTIAALGVAGVVAAKKLKEDAVPKVDLFADKVGEASRRVVDANGKITQTAETATVKISEGTKKAVGSYMKLDAEATKSLNHMYSETTMLTEENSQKIINTYDQMGQQVLEKQKKHNDEQYKDLESFFKLSGALTYDEEQAILQTMKTEHGLQEAETKQNTERIHQILSTASKEKRALTSDEMKVIKELQDKQKQNAVKTLSETEVESKVILERIKGNDKRLTAEQAAEHIKELNKSRDKAIKAAETEYEKRVAAIIRQRDETKTISKDQADKLIKEAERQKKDTIKKAEDQKQQVVKKMKEQNKDLEDSVDTSNGKIKSNWDRLKSWFSSNPIVRWIKSKVEEPATQRNVGQHWTGTSYFKGGLTTLHERGWELYDLPQGTKVYNHEASERMVTETAEQVATKVANSVLKNFKGLGNNATQTIIVPVKLDGKEIARVTAKPMSEELSMLGKRDGLGYV